MADRTLEIRLTGDVSNFSGAVNKASGDLEKMSGHLGTLKKLATGAALFEGFSKGVEFLGDATKAAIADETAMTRVGVSVKNAGENWAKLKTPIDEVLTKMSTTSGFMKTDLANAFSKLELATGNHTKALALERDAMNASAQTGKPLAAIALALGKAWDGSTGALGRLGIIVPKVTTEQDKLVAAHTRLLATGVKLTAAQKIAYKDALDAAKADDKQATATDALDTVHKKFADGVKDRSETMAGKLKIFQAQWEDIKVRIGDAILPLLTVGLGKVLAVVSWLGDNRTVVDAMIAAAGAVGAMVIAIKAWELATKAQIAVQAILDAEMDASPIGLIVIAIAALAAGLVVLYERSATFRSIVQGALGFVTNTVIPDLIDAWHAISPVVTAVIGVVKGAFDGMREEIGGVIDFIGDLIHGRWSDLWGDAEQVVKGELDQITNVFGGIGGLMTDWLGDVATAITGAAGGIANDALNLANGALNSITSTLSGIGGTVAGYVGDIATSITNGIGNMTTAAGNLAHAIVTGITGGLTGIGAKALTVLGEIITAITGWLTTVETSAARIGAHIITGVTGAIAGIGGKALDVINDIIPSITGWLDTVETSAARIGAHVITGVVSGLANIGSKALGVINDIIPAITGWLGTIESSAERIGAHIVTGIISGVGDIGAKIAGVIRPAVEGAANGVIDAVNSALSFSFDTHIPGVGTIHVDPPDIPHVAAGGIFTRPTIALIGEAGPEAVVPLSRVPGYSPLPSGGWNITIIQSPGETTDGLMQRLNLLVRQGG